MLRKELKGIKDFKVTVGETIEGNHKTVLDQKLKIRHETYVAGEERKQKRRQKSLQRLLRRKQKKLRNVEETRK